MNDFENPLEFPKYYTDERRERLGEKVGTETGTDPELEAPATFWGTGAGSFGYILGSL